ncbi:MAG: hypothetical protein IPH12_11770 [Saprospirales bacterium]|nr:hypothetical protein [Saprospirales bacterium]MBK8922082.1 hypothetical protein [Saprospirales bacterium]
MKKYRVLFLLGAFLLPLLLLAPACSQKSGCQATESLRAPVNKKGEIKSSRRSQSGLFPKSMTKKMKH